MIYNDLVINNSDETFIDVEGYDGKYKISNLGNIYSEYKKGYLKQRLTMQGYYAVSFVNGPNKKWHYVHRLLAQYFLPNPLNKPAIDHINRDRADNRLSNLRWSTYSENSLNSKSSENRKGWIGTSIYKYNNNTSRVYKVAYYGDEVDNNKLKFRKFKHKTDALEFFYNKITGKECPNINL